MPALDVPSAELAALAKVFHRFADFECDGIAPLYAHLSRGIAADRDLLALCLPVRPGVPMPNLLLASVQYLLLQGVADVGLRAYYPNLTDPPVPAEQAFPVFRRFCLAQRDAVRALIGTRGVVTSEVQRSACLLPGFLVFAADAPAFHLLDVGAGAGFNLLWDRYSIDYGAAILGDRRAAALVLETELRGPHAPPLDRPLPRLLSRQGIDLEPPNLEDPADRDWLGALVWPEQPIRRARLERAMAVVRDARPKILCGDALALLPQALADLPPAEPACVSHAFCLNQLNAAQRRRLETILRCASSQRLLGRLALEWPRRGAAPQLRLYRYRDGLRSAEYLAQADAHGAWLRWRGPAEG